MVQCRDIYHIRVGITQYSMQRPSGKEARLRWMRRDEDARLYTIKCTPHHIHSNPVVTNHSGEDENPLRAGFTLFGNV